MESADGMAFDPASIQIEEIREDSRYGGLRAKVRRLVRRGDALMRGGYLRLAQLAPLEKGRFEGDAKRP